MGRAQAWLERYDPKMWTDKSITRDDLEIVEEIKATRKERKGTNAQPTRNCKQPMGPGSDL